MSCVKAFRSLSKLAFPTGRSLTSQASKVFCISSAPEKPLLSCTPSLHVRLFSSSSSDSEGSSRRYFPPRVQSPAPDFKGTAVVNGDFKDIQLKDFKGKYLYLFFYPLDFTFVCPTEIIAFSDKIKEFNEINTNVIGCSCDSHFTHLAWINTSRKDGGLGKLNYPLLSDFNKVIAEDYNVLISKEGIPLRGSFIIDDKGIIRQITINDLPVGRSVDEVLRLIKAFQFTDKHGEVCPANWDDSKPTIKPNPTESKEYFNKVH